MTKITLNKFLFVSLSNAKRLITVNCIFLVPLLLLCFTSVKLVPVIIRYIDSMNITVVHSHPDHKRLAIVIFSDGAEGEHPTHDAYVFERTHFNSVRRHIFLKSHNQRSLEILRQEALGYAEVHLPGQITIITNAAGKQILTMRIDQLRENTIEIFFYRAPPLPERRTLIWYSVIFGISYLILAGSLCGISEYTQRVVFHETKSFSYLFYSIGMYFFRSLFISLFFTVIFSAVAANIYFYIFIMSADISVFIAAINFWMLVFFIFILLWVFPLCTMNRDESVWKVMKKSLFLSFDNFAFTLDIFFMLLLMGFFSVITFFIIPGFSGLFAFLNTGMKDLSSRYRRTEDVL
jgi:hypothetical protein